MSSNKVLNYSPYEDKDKGIFIVSLRTKENIFFKDGKYTLYVNNHEEKESNKDFEKLYIKHCNK